MGSDDLFKKRRVERNKIKEKKILENKNLVIGL